MIAMAAVVNAPAPAAETNLPPIEEVRIIESNEFTVAGEMFKEVNLWNGQKLTNDAKFEFAAAPREADIHVPEPKKPVRKVAKTYISAEEEVKAYFADIPIMIEVAKCESRYRHYDTTGDVLRGVVNNLDRGVMQINEGYHLSTSQKLGYDILTLEGNMAYARYLYQTQGTRPWLSSSPCWAKAEAPELATSH